MGYLKQCILSRLNTLFYYCPYSFIREIDSNNYILEKLDNFTKDANNTIIEIHVDTYIHYFFVSYLPWDSDYFNISSYKLFTVLYDHNDYTILSLAVETFKKTFFINSRYCFAEIPSEDILLIQALTSNNFRLIETRLTYFKDSVEKFENNRFEIRETREEDIANLKKVAIEARNVYDRVHADIFFSQTVADEYLATYIEEAIKGYADKVFVPGILNMPADAFLALSHMTKDSKKINCQLCRIILTAVAPTCKGWHYKLVSEAIYHAKSINALYVLMTTQSTNRAVVRNSEKLGFKLGATSHILSYYTTNNMQ